MRKHNHCPSGKNRLLWSLVVMIATALTARGQSMAAAGFIQHHDNVICNSIGLDPFFEKLFQLQQPGALKVSVVHIGDSHIQADYLTEVVRRNLQTYFGNAGRGLIVPYRVAGTNEPANFKSSSTYSWDAKRIVHPFKPMPIGIGGITLRTQQEGASFAIRLTDPLTDHAFSSVSLFYQNDETSFRFVVLDSNRLELGRTIENTSTGNPFHQQIELPSPARQIIIQGIKENEKQDHATLFGISLENGNSGLIYHAVGVNGAKYEHYNKAELFPAQTALLQPDLFIISLGTNESIEYPNISKAFSQEVAALVNRLSTHNPNASFLLVTPPDAFVKKVRHNPGVEIVRNQIMQFAVENGIAFWDMYRVNGGMASALRWRASGLLRPDGVHFTREGYALQGNLLYEALMKSYQQYVAARNP